MQRNVAVVTGGTGGIGTAICRYLSPDFQVVACYFKNGQHEEAKRWQEQQRQAGFEIDIEYADNVSFEDCSRLAASIVERYGHIEVLVNNAGVTADSSLRKMTPEQWHEVIDANLNGVFNITRNVLPHMLDKGYGRIVSISSINGRKGQFGQCNYAASKAALFGFTKSLALEVASKGITANTVSPGYIKTAMLAAMQEETLQAITNSIPVGHLGKPEDIARVVGFLVSPQSDFITGTNIDVNGGQYM